MKTAMFTATETVNTLTAIFEKHKCERVCVVGTICCGKTTLIKQIPPHYNCIDMDDEFWPQVSNEDVAYLSQTPFTKEMSDFIYKLIYEKITGKPGYPLFGFVILDCEAVVYLDIAEDLLQEHCKMRGTSFADALYIKKGIEEDWRNHKAKCDKVFYYLTITE